jgi:hypothetical protein
MSSELIAIMQSKCIEDGGCLVWDAYMHDGKNPQFKHKGKVLYARREWWVAHNGPVPKGKHIAQTCETRGCICHTEPQTVSQIQKRIGATGVYGNPARCSKIAASKRANAAKLTLEQARDIRYGGGTAKAKAIEHGVNPSTAAAIRRGERWKDYTASHFAGLGAR